MAIWDGPDGRCGIEDDLAAVPLLQALGRADRRRLSRHVDRLDLPDGAVVLEAGRPVQWLAVPLTGGLRARGGHDARRWAPGEVVGLAEGLTHDVAPATIVTDGPSRVLFLEVRALTAAVTVDPVLGLSVARALVPRPSPVPRRRRFERRRLSPVPVGSAA